MRCYERKQENKIKVPIQVSSLRQSHSVSPNPLSNPALDTLLVGCNVVSLTGARRACLYLPEASLTSMSCPESGNGPSASSAPLNEYGCPLNIGGRLSRTFAGRRPVPTTPAWCMPFSPCSPSILTTPTDFPPSSSSSKFISSDTKPMLGDIPFRRSRTKE